MKDLHATYYGSDLIQTRILNRHIEGSRHTHLMKSVYNEKNILYAIKRVASNKGRNTPGPDGLSYDDLKNIDENKVIEEIRLRLSGKIRPKAKKKYIPKGNGTTRPLGITNIYDRIAQQCVLNILEPIMEYDFYDMSYGFRRQVSTKHCLTDIIMSTLYIKDGSVFDCDLKKCFENIRLDDCLDKLRINHNIHDSQLIKCIKTLMWIDNNEENYIGIGLAQGSILGPILANVLLHDLEKIINDVNDYDTAKKGKSKHRPWDRFYTRAEHRHNLEAQRKYAKGRLQIKMIRYADDFVLICPNKFDLEPGIRIIEDWCKEHNLEINWEKSKILKIKEGEDFRMNFLGYTYRRNDRGGLIISIKDPKKTWKIIKKNLRLLQKQAKYKEMVPVILGVLYYYDICTNLNWLIKLINKFLYRLTRRTKMRVIKGSDSYTYGNIVFNTWDWRKESKKSIKEYHMNKAYWRPNLKIRKQSTLQFNYINGFLDSYKSEYTTHRLFIPGLIRKYKVEPISKIPYESIPYNKLQVHHIKPLSKGGLDTFSNMVLITEENHRLIHSNKQIMGNKNFVKAINKYREMLN